jgi:hypothetical protein
MIYRTIHTGIGMLAAWSLLLTVLLTLVGHAPEGLAGWHTHTH